MQDRNDWQGKTSRRRLLRGSAIGAAGLAAATMLGCGRPQSETQSGTPTSGGTTTNTAQPKRGGIISHITAADGVFNQGLDPHKTGGSETGLMNFFYQGILRLH